MVDGNRLINAQSGEVIIARLQLATTFWQRFRGLQLRSSIGPDEGLLLTPCRSIHTHWMRFAIDVAMLDRDGIVLSILSDLGPWRVAPRIQGTYSIVEAAAGTLARRLQVGERTAITLVDDNACTS